MKQILVALLILIGSLLKAQHSEDGWTLIAHDRQLYFAPTLANGQIGITPGQHPLQVQHVIQNGVYDVYGRGQGVTNIVKGINAANIEISINEEKLSEAENSDIKRWQQFFHIKTASLKTIFDYKDLYHVEYSQIALRHLPNTFITQVKIVALKPLNKVKISNKIQSSESADVISSEFQTIKDIHLLSAKATSPTGKHILSASNALVINTQYCDTSISAEINEETHLGFTTSIPKGRCVVFTLISSFASSAESSDPYNEAKRFTLFAYLEGVDKIIAEHYKAWATLWESDIIIEGDIQAQADVRFALYNLYASIRENSEASIAPMGLSGNGYNGHIFWDSEIWMFPPLLLLQPELAKSMLDYRYNRLKQAQQKAANLGYDGAMFPWESAETGEEETPVWALTGTFEHHITADIGIAFWNYFLVTRDTTWLREKGYPVLSEVADFWVSRSVKNEQEEYEIKNVVCADEYAENVDNNAFTNGAAKVVLKAAIKTSKVLGKSTKDEWGIVADGIVLRTFENGIIKEHESYKGETIKQADVNLLTYPLGLISDPNQIQKNLTYYSERVDVGPAMTHSIYSIIANRLGNCKKAFEYFEQGYKANQRPPFGVLAECQTCNNPYFTTGAGGMLQAVMNGFGGLEITEDGIIQKESCLPKHWKSLTVKGVGLNKKTYKVEH